MASDREEKLRGSVKGDARRHERLAAELRENLKRRKSRGRPPRPPSPADTPTDDDAPTRLT